MKELLEKYIQDRCTPEELQKVLPYIDTPQGRRELEELLMADWEDFAPEKAEDSVAGEWQDRLTKRGGKKPGKLTMLRQSWIGYAATVILVTGFGFYFLNREKRSRVEVQQVAMIEKFNPSGKRTILTLSDSSVVYLGAESRIRYPERFAGTKREISLEGEAFFEISHNPEKPFIVQTGKVETQVLGTSFKIEAFKGHQLTVSVATGRVSVGRKENSKLTSLAILTPGKMVSWNPSDNSTEISAIPIEDVRNLKNGTLAFKDTRLDKIALDLGRWYNTKIIITESKLTAYQLSITINGKASINGALDAITAATGLKYRISKDQIIIGQR
ncbi:transmembrane sensor [Pedobacter africanus]|uniref:Ferric-dicitrate binding protein FerR (Iron transport regulator) n=1 Tax=Pedobacter africanus TaxID=151894 RepID=A0ACC6L3X2_9SPHI|nr:FecR family protein [Pedobacter africanus]MDR6786046.1 ferric-dicitrate binding protein FerR (iron transport regulator) [Pedobacter africanus]